MRATRCDIHSLLPFQNNTGPPGFFSLSNFLPLSRKGRTLPNDSHPLPRLKLLDAVAQLCKHFAIPTALFALLTIYAPTIPLPIENGNSFPFGFAWMPLLWRLTYDAWFLLVRHWRDLIDAGASCILSFLDALGAALDGAAGAAVAGIMKCASPLLALSLVAMIVTLACSWIESTAPEGMRNCLGGIAFSCTIVAIALPPLRALAGDVKALAAALQ